MARAGKRRRRMLAVLALAALAAAAGLGWDRYRRQNDPIHRGWAAYDRGDLTAAEELARQRLKASARDPRALRLLARTSFRQGRDALAMSLYQRLGDADLEPEDRFFLGMALARSGKVRSAVSAWESARAEAADRADILFQLTRGYLALDRLAEATRAGEQLVRYPAWAPQAEVLLGQIALTRGDPGRAAGYWLESLAHDPGPGDGRERLTVPRKELARALLRVERPAEAREQLRTTVAEGADPEAFWLLSRADLQLKDWPAARDHLERGGSFRAANPMLPEPSAYVGADRCDGCHVAEARSQRASRHARTFLRASELTDRDIPKAPLTDPVAPKVVHELRHDSDGSIRQQTRADGRTFEAVVQYAFGSGDRGMTLVGRGPDGRTFELRLSRYLASPGHDAGATPAAGWDLTSGHAREPKQAEEYLGKPLADASLRLCLSCHLTSAQAVLDRSGPCASDHGIRCERCHGPAGNHLLAVEGKLAAGDPAIARPTMASGPRVVQLCAECHSPRVRTVARDDPTAVRFQGTTLTWSRCYTESKGALDCVTCHDPHRDAATSPASYEARCLDCHAREASTPTAAPSSPAAVTGRAVRVQPRARGDRTAPAGKACPVSPSSGCIGCHMPAVSGVVPHTSFTDHFIRVHRD